MQSIPNIDEFNSIFNAYYTRFLRFALGYVKETEVAEDFVLEAFSAYWENYVNLRLDTKPQAYILTIVKNKCLNYLQHSQVRQRAEQKINDHNDWKLQLSISTLKSCDPEFLFSKEIQQIVDNTLKRLPEKTHQIFNLSRNKGLSYKEIAAELNVSVKTVEFHISRALEHLRLSLKDFITLLPFLAYLL
ncbi:MAG: RNA polymerase sigma-70 factor [Bacteroidota bacterium]